VSRGPQRPRHSRPPSSSSVPVRLVQGPSSAARPALSGQPARSAGRDVVGESGEVRGLGTSGLWTISFGILE